MKGPATLWEGVQAAETRLGGVEDWVGSTLTQEVRKAKEQSLRTHSVDAFALSNVRAVLGTGSQSTLLQPLTNGMDAQEVRLRDQSRFIADLLATTRQQHSILVGVFDGSISIPQTATLATGTPLGGPYVSYAIFDTHVAVLLFVHSGQLDKLAGSRRCRGSADLSSDELSHVLRFLPPESPCGCTRNKTYHRFHW